MSAEKLEAIKKRCAEILAYYALPELPDDQQEGGAE